MATAPDSIRRDLLVIANEAQADLRAVASQAPDDPAGLRSALFAAAPLIVTEYTEGAAALALDWFEELRAESRATVPFRPVPVVTITDDEVAAVVARTTESLHEIQKDFERELEESFAESVKLLEEQTAEIIAQGFRETVTENAKADPESVGWRRFARPEACKFCKMLAAKGAVYTEQTARFAAHGAVMGGNRKGGNCMCIAGPAFGGQEIWAQATPMQYLASQRERTEEERKRLREYLNQKYPDAPG